ncbi:sulfatase [Salinigranum halophilum]|uniref:sulfatase n=1 Tax=Salinigranum halophilum TaxID=2565931 RepID=UPI0010A7A61C|nr:sulfatase [Salinigranum halophilum]
MSSHPGPDTANDSHQTAETTESTVHSTTEDLSHKGSTTTGFDATEPNHVILLSIDALRADHLGCHGYHRDTSPTVDRLSADGIRFSRAYSPSSHTREAVPALLSGQYPSVATTDRFRRNAQTIGHLLQGTTARSAGIHSNPFVSEGFGFGDGFDHFDDDMLAGGHWLTALAQRAVDKLRNRHYARAETVTNRGIEFLQSQAIEGGRPTFTWLHYMDVHGPYEPPAEFRRKYVGDRVTDAEAAQLYKRAIAEPDSLTNREQQRLIDLYDAEIRYLDANIGRLLDELSRLGIRDETLIILTADHGEAFGEHGYYEHPRFLPHELTHVPLIATGAGVRPRKAIRAPVSTLDVAPTVAEVFGVEYTGPGRSLAATAARPDPDRVVFAQARGEGEDAGIHRYAGYRGGSVAYADVDTETGERTFDAGIQLSLQTNLNAHINADGYTVATDAGRSEGGEAEWTTGDDAEDDVAHRLRALGYAE